MSLRTTCPEAGTMSLPRSSLATLTSAQRSTAWRRWYSGAGLIASHLFQTDRYAAHCSRHFSADPWAAELQDHAIGILQLNASGPSRNGTADSDRAVSAFNRSRPSQIEGPSDQLRARQETPAWLDWFDGAIV